MPQSHTITVLCGLGEGLWLSAQPAESFMEFRFPAPSEIQPLALDIPEKYSMKLHLQPVEVIFQSGQVHTSSPSYLS